MGKSGGGGGTTTSTNSSAPPADVMAQYDALIAQANQTAQQPLQQYQGNIVSPLSDYQNQAGNEVANLQGSSQPLYNQAQGLIQNASQPITPQTVNSADIQQYQNPYTQQVIDSTMANINQQDQGQQQQLIGNAAAQGAWGGDRSAVAQSLLAHQQDLANNQTIAGLENQGYSQALGEANTQQQAGLNAQEASQYLGQQGAAGLTNLGNTELSAGLTGAAALNSAGAQQQAQQQAQLNVPYEQFQQQQAFPYQNLSWLSSLSTGLGSNMGGTSTSSTTQPAPNSIFGFARGGHIDGLIKKLASGGAIMMPPHYDSGGLIPGQGFDITQQNSGIPNLDPNVFAGDPMTLTKGSGLPTSKATPAQQPSAMQQASQAVGLASGLNNLAPNSSSLSSMMPTSLSNLFSGTSQSAPVSPAGSITSTDLAPFSSSGASDAASSAGSSDMLSNMGDYLMTLFAKGGAVNPEIQKRSFGGNVLPDILSVVGDVAGSFVGDPMAGNQFTSTLSQVDGGETKPGFQLSNVLSRGGLVKHYDDGGAIDSVNGQFSQGLMGNDDFGLNAAPPNMSPESVANMPPSAPVHLSSDDANVSVPSKGLVSPNAQASSSGFTPIAIPTFHDDKPINEVSPWLSVAAGVAGALSGKSPYVLQNLASGALGGLETYGAQKKQAADETYKSASIQDARDQLVREAEQFNASGQQKADEYTKTLALDQQKADQMAKYQQGELARQNQALALQKLESSKPVFDKLGNPWQLDQATGKYSPMAKGQIGSGQNAYGYDIGSIPQGTSAPVIDPKYDPTIGMDITRKSINAQKTQDQLEKDNAAAAVNNDSIARLQAAKNVITTAPTGGVTNLLGIGPVADAFSTQRQELGALNKELAMAPGERPTNMRLTQGEVMMLKQAQPGNDKSTEANSAIADANIAIRTRPAEFATFKNDFVANNGYWNDAVGQQMYNQYTKDNPIIDVAKSGNGQIALNPNRQTIEQYANNGGFAKYGVKGNPQASTLPSTAGQGTSVPLPMPTSKDALVVNKTYNTAKGPATWNGTQFIPPSP